MPASAPTSFPCDGVLVDELGGQPEDQVAAVRDAGVSRALNRQSGCGAQTGGRTRA